jgi:hypothetical protein
VEVHEVRRRAVCVPVEHIEAYRRHPAVLVTTWVPVAPETEERSLATALRSAFNDVNLQRVVPAGQGIVLSAVLRRPRAISSRTRTRYS